jgi:hypothetical protein
MFGIESFAAPRDLLCSLFWGDLNGKSWEAWRSFIFKCRTCSVSSRKRYLHYSVWFKKQHPYAYPGLLFQVELV